jgi:hypothetical protein
VSYNNTFGWLCVHCCPGLLPRSTMDRKPQSPYMYMYVWDADDGPAYGGSAAHTSVVPTIVLRFSAELFAAEAKSTAGHPRNHVTTNLHSIQPTTAIVPISATVHSRRYRCSHGHQANPVFFHNVNQNSPKIPSKRFPCHHGTAAGGIAAPSTHGRSYSTVRTSVLPLKPRTTPPPPTACHAMHGWLLAAAIVPPKSSLTAHPRCTAGRPRTCSDHSYVGGSAVRELLLPHVQHVPAQANGDIIVEPSALARRRPGRLTIGHCCQQEFVCACSHADLRIQNPLIQISIS